MTDSSTNVIAKICILCDSEIKIVDFMKKIGNKSFPANYMLTLGVEPIVRKQIIGNRRFHFSIWVIAGQDAYIKTYDLSMKATHGSIVFFDVNNRSTFDNVARWVYETKSRSPNQIIGLIGLTNSKSERLITDEEAKEKTQEIDAIYYLETNLETGENIDLAFEKMGIAILDKDDI